MKILLAAAAIALLTAFTPPVDDVVDFGLDRTLRMTVPVHIDGKGPYHFIIDTGSERTVLSEELALKLGLDPTGIAQIHSASGIGMVDTVSVASLTVSEQPVRNLTAPLLKRSNLGAEGILGIDSLQSQRILLNFRAQTMTVSPSERPQEIKYDDATIVVRAKNRLGRLILADAEINDRKVAVVIDTGAEHSIGNAVLARMVLRRGRADVIATRIISVIGDSVPAEIALVKSMRIGNLTMTGLPIAFADLQIFQQLGLDRKPAILLGMNTLRAFDLVSVDFAKREVRFVIPGDSSRLKDTELAQLAR